jgi:hypothetical protein
MIAAALLFALFNLNGHLARYFFGRLPRGRVNGNRGINAGGV